jgi:hypothetical protein
LLLTLATLLARLSPKISQASLTSSKPVLATTLVCVCKSLPFWASVRQRHNSSIDSAIDSATRQTRERGPVD